ncbi:MAG: Ig-like domain-containing protein [Planctomycetes bacterium]|nr:Ig-like domain-containing protein [Planctomycetota bacterium]
MRRALFASVALFATTMFAPCALAADPPRVVRTTPADGATDVPLDVGVLRVEFDRPMRTDGWTLWQVADDPFPPLDGPDATRWVGPQTLEARLARLIPGTRYAVQLNAAAAGRRAFAAADGTPLEDVVVRFTATGAAPLRDDGPPREGRPDDDHHPAALCGTWATTVRGQRVEREFVADGRVRETWAGGLARSWRWDARNALVLDTDRALVFRLEASAGPPPQLRLTRDDGYVVDLDLVPGAPRSRGAAPHVGAWQSPENANGFRHGVTLGADGAFRHEFGPPDQRIRVLGGTYHLDGTTLEVTGRSIAAWSVDDEGGLHTQDLLLGDLRWTRVERDATADRPDRPDRADATLAGTWRREAGDVISTLDLGRDGRYAQTVLRGGRERRSAGAWAADGGRLTLRRDGEDAERVYRFRLDGDGLQLFEADGTEIAWRRATAGGAGPVRPWVGVWTAEGDDGDVRLALGADGRFAWSRDVFGDVTRRSGTYRAAGATLSLAVEGGGTIDYGWRLLDDGRLELSLPGGAKTVLTREATATPPARTDAGRRTPPPEPEPEPPPAPPRPRLTGDAAAIVGVWTYRAATSDGWRSYYVSWRTQFKADGRFQTDTVDRNGAHTVRGSWRVADGRLVTRADEDEKDVVWTYRLLDRDSLHIAGDEGNGITFHREP